MSDCQIIHILQITFYSIVFTSILTYVDTILGLVPATASNTEDGSTRIVVYRGCWGDEAVDHSADGMGYPDLQTGCHPMLLLCIFFV